MSPGLRGTTLLTALGCGLSGGVFFAFSSFVMPALGRLPAPAGIAAMQSINVAAVRPAFLTALFAPAAGCGVLVVQAARHRPERPAVLLVVGGGLYLVATIGLTVARHVPLNDALAALDPSAPASAEHWAAYLSDWTRWNHVRAASSLAAAAVLTLALLDPESRGTGGQDG